MRASLNGLTISHLCLSALPSERKKVPTTAQTPLRRSSGSHGIRYPRPDAAQRLASDGDGDRGSDRAQPLATEGGGDGGSGTAQPLASAGSSTRRAGRKQLQMSDFFRA